LLASSLQKDQRGTECQRRAKRLAGSSCGFIPAQTVACQPALPSPSPCALCSPAEIRGAEQQAHINGEFKKLSGRLDTVVRDGPQRRSRYLPELHEPGDHTGPSEGLSLTAGHHVRDGLQSLSRRLPELQECGDHKGPPERLRPTTGHHVKRWVIHTGPRHANPGLHHGRKHLQKGMSSPIFCF